MFFDDRLATVLRQRMSSDIGLRTQYRQLLDILGAERDGTQSARDHSLVASAWLRMDALADKIPAEARARMIRETGWRFRNPELAAHLADFEPDVASAALNRAQLSAEDWNALIPRLPVRARGFLRLRRDLPVDVETLLERLGVHDRGLPSPEGSAPIGSAPRPKRARGPFPTPADFRDETESALPLTPTPEPGVINADSGPPHDVRADGAELPPVVRTEPVEQPLAEADVETEVETEVEVEVEAEAETQAEVETEIDIGSDAEDNILPPDQPLDAASEGRSEISALVERIAQFKRTRETAAELDANEPRLPLGEDQRRRVVRIASFGFAADAAGRIEWADGEVPAMVIGTRLIAPPRLGSSAGANPIERAFARRQPITAANKRLDGAEAIVGDWIVDAQPRFTDDGNFAGYIGRFRRVLGDDPSQPSAAEQEADRIRQLLHELRTPVTAVQGYAEVIQQQLFGTAPHEYRALAAAIAADAARILAGFEELDLLAKLETGLIEAEIGETDLATLALRTNRQIEQVLQPRMAGIEFETGDMPHIVALAPDQTEALLWRLLATLGGGCSSGEILEAEISSDHAMARLVCDLPAQLLSAEDIFTAEAKPVGEALNAGLFGAGFALRLARAEANAAGGALKRDDEKIVLTLPLVDDDADSEMLGDG